MLRPRFAVVVDAAGVFAAPRAARGAAAPRDAVVAEPAAARADVPDRDAVAVAGVFFFVGALPARVDARTIFAMPR